MEQNETNHRKLERKTPCSFSEILQLVSKSPNKITARSVLNYLAELEALGLVTHDNGSKLYHWRETKMVFKNKAEYEIVLMHSKGLVFSSSSKQRLDQTDPYLALDMLVFETRDIDDKCLLQHIKTGYADVYALMQKYRKLMEEKAFSKLPHLPKLSGGFDFWELDPSEMVAYAATLSCSNNSNNPKNRQLKELYDLRDLLVGKIYFIINQVKNGIPLLGYCDCCPHLHVSVQG